MAYGYYYKDGKLVQGEHPEAKATVIEAQQSGQMGPSQATTLDYSSPDNVEKSAYLQKLQQYNQPSMEEGREPAQQDAVAGAKEANAGSAGMSGAGTALKANDAGGNKAQTLGAGMTTAGAASGNPYLAAAGLAVSAYGSIEAGKQKREQNKYLAEVQKFNARQASIEKMAQIGAGLKA